MNKHVRYVGAGGAALCEKPDLIGKPFVYIDQAEPITLSSCPKCLSVLTRHFDENPELMEQPVNEFFRGVMYASAFSSAFWLCLFSVLWGAGVIGG